MKMFITGSALAILTVLGVGCQKQPTVSDQRPPATNASTTVSDTVPATWRTDVFGSGWSMKHPNRAEELDPASEEVRSERLLLRVELGSAVMDPGTKYVPTRRLEIHQLKANDPRLGECNASLVGKQGVYAVSRVTTTLGTELCLQTSRDAGAGNLYDTEEYILQEKTGSYAISFITHSVQCQNYEHPDEQCMMYDKARDTALFPLIINTLTKI